MLLSLLLLSILSLSGSECVTVYGTFNNTKVSTGWLKSAVSTESSTNNNLGLNDAISSGACERYNITMVRIVCAPFLWKRSNFWGVKLSLKMKLLKVYLHQNQWLKKKWFF